MRKPIILIAKTLLIMVLIFLSCDCDNGDENTEPQVNIIQPMDGDIFDEGDSIAFDCDAYDAEDGDLGGESVIWTSSIDGEFGCGTALLSVLNSGSHIIRAFATDSEEKTANDSICLLVLSDYGPEIYIESPTNGWIYGTGVGIEFRCSATDIEDSILSGESIVWTSSIIGDLGTDTSFTIAIDQPGTHIIRAIATDSDGRANMDEIVIEIIGIEELIPVGYLTTGGDAHDIDVEGDIAYLAAYDAGLFTIDVSDPTNPVELGNFRTADGFAVQVDAQDNFIYMSDFHYFRILDANDPSNLIQVDEHREIIEESDSLVSNGFYCEVCVHDTLVYLSQSRYQNIREYLAYKVNVSNPLEPVYSEFHPVDTIGIGYSVNRSLFIHNDLIYGTFVYDGPKQTYLFAIPHEDNYVISSSKYIQISINDIHIQNNILFATAYEDGIWIFDVSSPESIDLLSKQLEGIRHINIDIKDNYAYVACGWDGLKVIDITNPLDLKIVAEYRSTDYVREIKVGGNYAYVADGYNGLAILDISAFN